MEDGPAWADDDDEDDEVGGMMRGGEGEDGPKVKVQSVASRREVELERTDGWTERGPRGWMPPRLSRSLPLCPS